ncbi:hypothetical protein ACR9YC_02125 [Parasphingorhabdus sp. DH2-15]|uniref:hypothetical protein n=1 Tax=Parasphingorhabdus sp. DH2-15 TaxID=3444112 RepID=UPI003F687D8E
MESDDGRNFSNPNIFYAAINNDVGELSSAINEGQSLADIQDEQTLYTPIHVASIHNSLAFLQAAENLEYDPWTRDSLQRLPIDHAAALGFKDIQKLLLEKMYPPGWDKDTVVPFDKLER